MGEPSATGEGYRGPQVCAVVGITYRQLDYWARTDLLRPSISEAKGSGTQRLYSYSDLLQIKVIKRLLDSGISLRSARRAIDCLRSSGDDVASANLVIDEGRTVLARSGEEIIDLLKGGQGVLNIVPMAGVVSEVDAAILSLGLPAGAVSGSSGGVSGSSGGVSGSSGGVSGSSGGVSGSSGAVSGSSGGAVAAVGG
jgi:DNA-binding transcriptional MerR regulator